MLTILNALPWSNHARGLIDTGSQTNLVTFETIQRLRIATSTTFLPLTGPQETKMPSATQCATITIKLNHGKVLKCTFYIVQKIICNLPIIPPREGIKTEFQHLKLADPTWDKPGPIDMLLGLGIWIKIVESKLIKSRDESAVAQLTKLGYILFQAPSSNDQSTVKICTSRAGPAIIDNHILNSTMKRFWEVEELPFKQRLTKDEQTCEDLFKLTHKRTPEGRYIVTMPFNDKINLLGKSKQIALRQLFAMERKMNVNPKFKNDYIQYMKEFEAQGFMKPIHETNECGYYTPHHGVYGASKDKIRIVYNASCKTSTGISLNECQHTGAKLQDDLADILIRFRTHRIGITADIKAMYCQVEMAEEDQKYQKILWRYDTKEPVKVYQLTRVAFGQTAAPFLAIRAMQQCADDHSTKYPRGAPKVKSSFYVDDLLHGADTPKEAIIEADEIDKTLESGKFPLTKWCSNSNEVNQHKSGSAVEIDIKDPEMKTVLGLKWQAALDLLTYKLISTHTHNCWTKRSILSEIGKLYDPNGFITPIIIIAKILIQDIWKTKTDWDDKVDPHIERKWLNFRMEIHAINQIRLPRWLGTSPRTHSELHGFADASKDAYACCVYVRTIQPNNQIIVRLIQSKTKVAPLKSQTIPRLELCGAYILAKLLTKILQFINIPISQSYCWTDSEVVLQWLRKEPASLKTFVQNRVAYIQENTIEKGINWRWTPTSDNPADIASRGSTPTQLASQKIWWNGPDWLIKDPINWPTTHLPSREPLEATVEARKIIESNRLPIICAITISPSLNKATIEKGNVIATDIFEAYSNFEKLWHTIGYVIRARNNFKLRDKTQYNKDVLTREELDEARLMIIKDHQSKHFKKQIKELSEPNSMEKIGRDCSIWLDPKTKTLRFYGRVTTDNLTFDEKFPILIAPNTTLAKLLLRYAHSKTGHGGAQQMIQLLRKQYWIYRIRQSAQSMVRTCKNCFRYHLNTANTFMAALPTERTIPQRPFKECGVDYMGPVNIASRRGRAPPITKGYVCVFVCFVSRAIHLELVTDGTKEAFIQALRRMTARRGAINTMWSDNGTTFIGANNFLKETATKHQEWAPEIQHLNHFKWKFIVPRAPSWGGIWEAAVKSVKKHIVRVVGSHNLTFEEYSTLLAQVESWVNSRPLVPLTDDPKDNSALTPAHFLIGESLIAIPEPEQLENRRTNSLRRWELVQQFNQTLWKRWHDEYVTTLINRTKWRLKTRNFKLNDLVIIKEDNLPPNKWHMGRIIGIIPSKDEFVRAVKIRTITGEYIRPILKIALLLPVSDVEDEQNSLRPITEAITPNLSKFYDKLLKKNAVIRLN